MSRMRWAFLIALFAFTLLTSHGEQRHHVPWAGSMRRVQQGKNRQPEWMAPAPVLDKVQHDYLAAMQWLQAHAAHPARHISAAGQLLSGQFLHEYAQAAPRAAHTPACYGVLRADHRLEVRRFSENGEECLVIDHQSDRRMATYRTATHERIHTQDLGAAVVVYAMVYDARAARWKIDDFVQELPPHWGERGAFPWLREDSVGHITGRDA